VGWNEVGAGLGRDQTAALRFAWLIDSHRCNVCRRSRCARRYRTTRPMRCHLHVFALCLAMLLSVFYRDIGSLGPYTAVFSCRNGKK